MTLILDALPEPIVLAPLAGGPSTPELAAAVSNAGGFGFLAAGYLSADAMATQIAAVRAQTGRPFGVNVFCPAERPADPATYAAWVQRVTAAARARDLPVGEPRFDDDDWEAKLALLTADPVPVVSFTFGCPPADTIAALQSAGSEVWVTVTAPEEARLAAQRGADALVAQGSEAGGHRGSFVDPGDLRPIGLLPLLALVQRTTDLPLVAAGGLTSGPSIAGALAAGARAAALGTAFMLAPEAGTSAPHRDALARGGATVLTRAFSGRLARGIDNAWIAEHGAGAPAAYPELHHVTAPLRRHARAAGEAGLINLWAGEAHELALARPAGEIVARLADEARAALSDAARRVQAGGGPAPPTG